MHTFESEQHYFFHNGDYSGEVQIAPKFYQKDDGVVLEMKEILDFVAQYIRRNKISKLEEASTEEILNLIS